MATTYVQTLRPIHETSWSLPQDVVDLRDRDLFDSSGQLIGQIDDLLVDEDDHRPRFLHVTPGGASAVGFLIPVDAITRIVPDEVHVHLSKGQIEGAPRVERTSVDRLQTGALYSYYGYLPYWSEGYSYPQHLETHSTETPVARTLIGVFNGLSAAEGAVTDLRRAGFRDDQIGFVTRRDGAITGDRLGATAIKQETGDASAEGALGGAIAGGSLATLWGLAVAAGLLPAIGPVVAGGAVAALLASAAVGAAVGGVFGFLVGLGVPEDDARHFERELASGRTLVTIRSADRLDEAAAILERHGGFTDSRKATPY